MNKTKRGSAEEEESRDELKALMLEFQEGVLEDHKGTR